MAPIFMEVALKLPRFTISALMALVLLVALDIWVCKQLPRGGPTWIGDLTVLIIVGALPMANVLALGLYPIVMPRRRHERSDPGRVGFEVGGLAALLLYLAGSVLMPHPMYEGVVHLLRALGFVPGLVSLVGGVVLLLLPQLGVALFGVWLYRRYDIRVKITVERGSPSGTEPETTTESLVAQGV